MSLTQSAQMHVVGVTLPADRWCSPPSLTWIVCHPPSDFLMVRELHVSLEHGTAEVRTRAPAPSVRCLTFARVRSLVFTPTVCFRCVTHLAAILRCFSWTMQANDRSKKQSQQAARTRWPAIEERNPAVFCVERGRNGLEAVHVARPLNSAFSKVFCMRAWWWCPTTASFPLCGSQLVPRGLSALAMVMVAGDVEAPRDPFPLFPCSLPATMLSVPSAG